MHLSPNILEMPHCGISRAAKATDRIACVQNFKKRKRTLTQFTHLDGQRDNTAIT